VLFDQYHVMIRAEIYLAERSKQDAKRAKEAHNAFMRLLFSETDRKRVMKRYLFCFVLFCFYLNASIRLNSQAVATFASEDMKWLLGDTAHKLRFNHIHMWCFAYRLPLFCGLMMGTSAGTDRIIFVKFKAENMFKFRYSIDYAVESATGALKERLRKRVASLPTVAEVWLESVADYENRFVSKGVFLQL